MSEVHEYDDAYSESLDREVRPVEADFHDLEAALLDDTVKLLAPNEPIRLGRQATVQEAIMRLVATRRSAVVIVDDEGRLVGIFSERDVLMRVIGQGRDPARTALADVMTPDPEALAADDRICYAVNRMNNGSYRTIPIVDAEHRPIGIVTVNDVIKWLAALFPEAIQNLRPGDRILRPHQVDAG